MIDYYEDFINDKKYNNIYDNYELSDENISNILKNVRKDSDKINNYRKNINNKNKIHYIFPNKLNREIIKITNNIDNPLLKYKLINFSKM